MARLKTPKLLDDDVARAVFDPLAVLVGEMGRSKLVLNLAPVEYLPSLALGKLVMLNRKAEAAGFDAPDVMYVGDRVDNDVAPALAFGMAAVHIRRGPWGYLHETPPGVRRIESLLELV